MEFEKNSFFWSRDESWSNFCRTHRGKILEVVREISICTRSKVSVQEENIWLPSFKSTRFNKVIIEHRFYVNKGYQLKFSTMKSQVCIGYNCHISQQKFLIIFFWNIIKNMPYSSINSPLHKFDLSNLASPQLSKVHHVEIWEHKISKFSPFPTIQNFKWSSSTWHKNR